jgi:IS5 family transposase
VILDKASGQILATAFCAGKRHDLSLFKQSQTRISPSICCLADSGYQGIRKDHENSRTPKKKSKHHPLTHQDKSENRMISQERISCEHGIGRLKVFRILAERYRNRRRRFGLRFNLIAAICNLDRNT